MLCLVLSGLSAFPLQGELGVLAGLLSIDTAARPEAYTGLRFWIATVNRGLRESYERYPFIGYGTDWLAFGHLVIAFMFIGPWRDPVRNRWVVTAGLVACAGVIPLAFVAGQVRGIPLSWRLIDCSFGVLGFVPLWLCRRAIDRLEATT